MKSIIACGILAISLCSFESFATEYRCSASGPFGPSKQFTAQQVLVTTEDLKPDEIFYKILKMVVIDTTGESHPWYVSHNEIFGVPAINCGEYVNAGAIGASGILDHFNLVIGCDNLGLNASYANSHDPNNVTGSGFTEAYIKPSRGPADYGYLNVMDCLKD